MPYPARTRIPSTARPAAVAASVVLATLLNAGAIGMAADLAMPGAPAAPAPQPAPLRTRVVLLAPLPPAPAVHKRAAGPRAASPMQPLQRLAAAVAPPPAAPRAGAAAQTTDRAAPQLRLYGFDEVDVPAAPESEWALDIATLDHAGITRLAFELMVDERGAVIACNVLDPTGLDTAVRADLERRLASTRLHPAERGGRFVASVRRIELRVDPAD